MPDYTPGENEGRKVRIRKNVPVPPPNKKWRWDEMEIGDCIDAHFNEPGNEARFIRQMRVQASRAGRKYGRKFRTRVTPRGLRIWRKS
jgi:hypothetical protein